MDAVEGGREREIWSGLRRLREPECEEKATVAVAVAGPRRASRVLGEAS